jgi:hypothetical protein
MTKKSKSIKPPKFIFLFILDAVRKDHLRFYGYSRKTTPNIDKLAKQSDIYQWAFSPSSYTLTSVSSIIAGKYPIELSNLFTGGEFSNKDFESLENLKNKGYKTAMFTANIVTSHYHANLYKYFDFFWDELTEKESNRDDILYQKAEVVLKNVRNFISKNKKKKLFIVIHLMEAHGPYTPWIESVFKGDAIYKKDKRKIGRVVNDMLYGINFDLLKKFKIIPRYQLLNLIEGSNKEICDYNSNINEYIAKYDMGIYLMDKEVGGFLNFLQKNKMFEQSKIAITSDHGEMMGEENLFFAHGSLTHPSLVSTPLIIKNPYQKAEKTIKDNFLLIDIFSDEKNRDVIITHPQSFSLVEGNYFINVHNADLSHNGALYQNIFVTNDYNLENIFDNFINLKEDIKIDIFVKNKIKLCFKKLKSNDKTAKIINSLLFLQKNNYLKLKSLTTNNRSFVESKRLIEENQNLHNQIEQTKIKIKNLENTFNMIKSSKFFKLWQTYCNTRDNFFNKYDKNKSKK